jgi:hypothetical protein
VFEYNCEGAYNVDDDVCEAAGCDLEVGGSNDAVYKEIAP